MNIVFSQSIQLLVDMHPGGTTFCLRTGVHRLTSSIKPKTGNTFVGEYGAILDGTGWTTADDTQGAFRAHNEDIDFVTIRNLVIRRMPQRGIQAYHWMSDHWTIEDNELAYNKYGIEFAPDFVIRRNYIHHNAGPCLASKTCASVPAAERGGGYAASHAHRTVFDGNEIAYNGMEQKVLLSDGVVFRNNFVHHNAGDGIWYDTNYAADALVEGNTVEDNGANGIDMEATHGATIRNNTLRRNAFDGVLIFRSQNVQTYNNTFDSNLGGVEYFTECEGLLPGEALQNNATYENTIIVGTAKPYSWASSLSFHSNCTAEQRVPYLNGSKNLTFSRNTYRVPSATGRSWLWGGWKFWKEWHALGHDLDGRLSQ